MNAGVQVRLVGMEHSLFTGKVRAYLRWKGISFEEVLATQVIPGRFERASVVTTGARRRFTNG
jgi:hypothetical protein